MPAESIFAPISRDLIRQARRRLLLADLTPASWARQEGFDQKTVYSVLSGTRRCIRGQSLQIAIKLGLRPDPSDPDDQSGPPAAKSPDNIAGAGAITDWDRRPESQLGQALR